MGDLLLELNEQQYKAVTTPLGPVLVLAGAGSGKTRVLTCRLVYLLQKKIFKPENLLALTFTNKAAGEMKERTVKLLGGNLPARSSLRHQALAGGKVSATSSDNVAEAFRPPLTMGTFHSVCARILRKEISRQNRGYSSNFVIYDTNDSLGLIKQIIIEWGLTERFRPNLFAYYFSAAKNQLISPQELALDNEYLLKTLQDVFKEYQNRLLEHNAVDFDDLLMLICELFRKHPKILKSYQERFKYILVDEYQDTNHAQYIMLKMLAARHRNIFVVGDDAQSIYGFRGANMQNILDFEKDYPEAKMISLEQNYRSTQNILDAASSVIRLNPQQYEKRLWTKNQSGSKIYFYQARDEVDEGEFVVRRIIGSQGLEVRNVAEGFSLPDGNLKVSVTYTPILDSVIRQNQSRLSRIQFSDLSNFQSSHLSDTVILYRTHAQSRVFEEVLVASGIPYQIVGGIKFYERKEIKDILAYLRVVFNPKDLVSLSRIINVPSRGIGGANFRLISKALAKYHYNYECLLLNLDKIELSAKAFSSAKEFFGLLNRAADLSNSKSLLKLMRLLFVRSGYRDDLLSDLEHGNERLENVEELFNVASRYKNLPLQEGLRIFLEEVALMTDLDEMEEKSNKLTLMTLHSAKGLEFDNVFLVGLEEGLLPHIRSLLSPQELAEEIRLAYVGMTRAKKNLYLSYAQMRQSYGELKRAVPSRIIKAIPKRLIIKLN